MSASAKPLHGFWRTWMARRRPRHDEKLYHFSLEKPGDATSRCDVPFAAGVRGFFTNFQFIKHLKTVLTFSRHMVI